MDLEKMRQEEAELEKMYYKTDEEEITTEEVVLQEEEVDEPTTVTVQETDDHRESWKKRFSNYKASTDNTIRQLRLEVAHYKSALSDKDSYIGELRQEINTLKGQLKGTEDPFKDIFTKEDEDLIGVEAVDIIKKAMKNRTPDNNEVTALKREIEEMKKENARKAKEEVKNLEAESLNALKAKLTKYIPEWSDIDLEEAFGKYLEGIDEISGEYRANLFTNAIHSRDVAGVARFYKEYLELKPKSREDILKRKVGVTGSRASSTNTSSEDQINKRYHISEYTRFMDEVARGDWKGKEKEARIIEKRFDKAYLEGRIYQ